MVRCLEPHVSKCFVEVRGQDHLDVDHWVDGMDAQGVGNGIGLGAESVAAFWDGMREEAWRLGSHILHILGTGADCFCCPFDPVDLHGQTQDAQGDLDKVIAFGFELESSDVEVDLADEEVSLAAIGQDCTSAREHLLAFDRIGHLGYLGY